MVSEYPGPLRGEPLAIELHNTLHAAGGRAFDGLADPKTTRAWLTALGTRLPAGSEPGPWPRPEQLVELRDAVRSALRAAVDDTPQPPAVLEALNEASRLAPSAPVVDWTRGERLELATSYLEATRSDVVLAALAADAIALLTGPHRDALRACGAPGCVLLYLKDHPRRAWCSNTCGNRARQARHYRRTAAPTPSD